MIEVSILHLIRIAHWAKLFTTHMVFMASNSEKVKELKIKMGSFCMAQIIHMKFDMLVTTK